MTTVLGGKVQQFMNTLKNHFINKLHNSIKNATTSKAFKTRQKDLLASHEFYSMDECLEVTGRRKNRETNTMDRSGDNWHELIMYV